MVLSATTKFHGTGASASASSSGGLPAIHAPILTISEIFQANISRFEKDIDVTRQRHSKILSEQKDIQNQLVAMKGSEEAIKPLIQFERAIKQSVTDWMASRRTYFSPEVSDSMDAMNFMSVINLYELQGILTNANPDHVKLKNKFLSLVEELDGVNIKLKLLATGLIQMGECVEAWKAGDVVAKGLPGKISRAQIGHCEVLLYGRYKEWQEKFLALEREEKDGNITFAPKSYSIKVVMPKEYQKAVYQRAILLEIRNQIRVVKNKAELQDVLDVLEIHREFYRDSLKVFYDEFRNHKPPINSCGIFIRSLQDIIQEGSGTSALDSGVDSSDEDLSKLHAGMKHKSAMSASASASASGASQPPSKKQKKGNDSVPSLATANGVSAAAEVVVTESARPHLPSDFPKNSLLEFLQMNQKLSVEQFEKFLAPKSKEERMTELARSHRGWTVEMVLAMQSVDVFDHYIKEYRIKFSSDKNLPVTDCGYNLFQLMAQNPAFNQRTPANLTQLIQRLLVDPEEDYCLLNQALNGKSTPAAIHLAVQSRQIHFVQALIDAGAYPLNMDYNGRNPLHTAIKCYLEPSMLQLLLKNYYVWEYARKLKDYDNDTPVDLAQMVDKVNDKSVLAVLNSAKPEDRNAKDERFYRDEDVTMVVSHYEKISF